MRARHNTYRLFQDSIKEFDENLWNTQDHNHLRITRMLKSLMLLGLEKEAGNVFDELMQIVSIHGVEEQMSVPISFWKDALEPFYKKK